MKGLTICCLCIGLFSLIFFPLSCVLSQPVTPEEIQAERQTSEARKKEKSTVDKVATLAFLAAALAVLVCTLISDIKSGRKKAK